MEKVLQTYLVCFAGYKLFTNTDKLPLEESEMRAKCEKTQAMHLCS